MADDDHPVRRRLEVSREGLLQVSVPRGTCRKQLILFAILSLRKNVPFTRTQSSHQASSVWIPFHKDNDTFLRKGQDSALQMSRHSLLRLHQQLVKEDEDEQQDQGKH